MSLPENTTEESVRRVFHEGFAARDLAEPLASFDVTTDTRRVRRFMVNRPLRVVGIRDNGLVTGYVEQDEITDQPLAEQAIPLAEASVLTTSAPFQEIITRLDSNRFLIITALGQPTGVIVRNDLQKHPMRMWLFGMVTLFDMKITRLLRGFFGDDGWVQHVSESRLEKAKQLQSERARRKQSVDLMDCLQLGDKGQLMARSGELRERYWNRSRRHIDRVIKQLERLRNNLAHSQDIVTENWEAIVRIAETLDLLFDAPGALPANASFTPHGPEDEFLEEEAW